MRTTLWTLCLLASVAQGAGKPAPKTEEVATDSSPSQFQIEKGLLEEIYKGSVSETVGASTPLRSALSITPQFSYLSPKHLTLSNNYWEVPYSDQVGALPSFSLGVASPIAYWGGLIVSMKGALGYSYREMVVSSISKQTGNESRTPLTLHWLPVSLGAHLEYTVRGFEAVKPYLNLEGGAQWLYQSGKLDGIEQGFWVPFYQVAFGLTLFGQSRSASDWFGGVNVGASLRNSVASQQNVQAASLDVGLNLYL